MVNKVFTYGTLMKGQKAYGIFGDIRYLGDGTLENYGIYETGFYPAAVPKKGFRIYGELYEVNDEVLKKFDEYEEEGCLYARKLVKIDTAEGSTEAWFYEYLQSIQGMELRAPEGKWTSQRKPYCEQE